MKTIPVFTAILGAMVIVITTNPYGIGLSPDSVGYTRTARNISEGKGVFIQVGIPLVASPPLYPLSLSVSGLLSGIDPVVLLPYINALLFGLMVYTGGLLLKNTYPVIY